MTKHKLRPLEQMSPVHKNTNKPKEQKRVKLEKGIPTSGLILILKFRILIISSTINRFYKKIQFCNYEGTYFHRVKGKGKLDKLVLLSLYINARY